MKSIFCLAFFILSKMCIFYKKSVLIAFPGQFFLPESDINIRPFRKKSIKNYYCEILSGLLIGLNKNERKGTRGDFKLILYLKSNNN